MVTAQPDSRRVRCGVYPGGNNPPYCQLRWEQRGLSNVGPREYLSVEGLQSAHALMVFAPTDATDCRDTVRRDYHPRLPGHLGRARVPCPRIPFAGHGMWHTHRGYCIGYPHSKPEGIEGWGNAR